MSKNVSNEKVQDLTEQWKNRKLEEYKKYYCKTEWFEDVFQARCYNKDTEDEWWVLENGNNVYHIKDIEVLAPVPSYEEWEEKQKSLKVLAEAYCKEKQENKQLKAQIAKLTEIVGVLPSNHSVGNLGYKIKNQRHEINNRLKEIDKLKELLKECVEVLNDAQMNYEYDDSILDICSPIITKIDEVLK